MPDTPPVPLSPAEELNLTPPPRLELTDLERAAMSTDLHCLGCNEDLGLCEKCMGFLRMARRVIAKVAPLVAEPLAAEIDRLEQVKDDLAELNAELLLVLENVRDQESAPAPRPAVPEDGTGDDGAPVTAPKGSSKAAENTQEPCGICSGYGCPDCREETDRG